MALRKIYIGTLGPFYFDDAVALDDPDADFAGVDHEALVTDGQLYVATSPSIDEHVVRLVDLGGISLRAISVADIDNPTELSGYSGDVATLMMAYEVNAGTNAATLYIWDASLGGANSPYIVAGSSGYWVAIAGRYSAQIFDTAEHYRVDTLQVVGNREPAIADPAYAAGNPPTKTEFDALVDSVRAVINRMKDHGLIYSTTPPTTLAPTTLPPTTLAPTT